MTEAQLLSKVTGFGALTQAIAFAAAFEVGREQTRLTATAEAERAAIENTPSRLREALTVRERDLPGYGTYGKDVVEPTFLSPYRVRYNPPKAVRNYRDNTGDTVQLASYVVSHAAGTKPTGVEVATFTTMETAQDHIKVTNAKVQARAFVAVDTHYSRRGSAAFITDGYKVVDALGVQVGYFEGNTQKAKDAAHGAANAASNAVRRVIAKTR